MFLYVIIEAIIAVIAGILIAVCAKKVDGVVYSKLDKAGRITNIILTMVYVCLSPLFMFLGAIARPRYEGFLGVIGWIVAIIIASTALPSGIGLGLSVAYRKKGMSKKSFIVQFAGLCGMALAFVLFLICYGNLLLPIN